MASTKEYLDIVLEQLSYGSKKRGIKKARNLMAPGLF